MLCTHAVQDSTRQKYSNLIKLYWQFCDKYNLNYFNVSSRQVLKYIWYLYKHTDKRHKVADQCITALGNYWKLNGFDWDRKQYPTVRMMLTGYRDLKPSATKERRPFTIFHLRAVFEFLYLSTYTGALIAAILIIGYYFGARAGEYSASSVKKWKSVILRRDLTIIDRGHNCWECAIIDFKRHKSNRWGLYNAKVPASCACDSGICPTWILRNYLKFRRSKWGKAKNKPLLLMESGYPVKPDFVNNMIKNLVRKIGLNEEIYSSHSLRSGRATDLARSNKSAISIKKWGRWRSNCWEDFYAKLDFNDIAILSRTSPEELGLYDNEISALSNRRV